MQTNAKRWRDFCVCVHLATAEVVTFQLQEMVLVEEGFGKHAGKWASKAEKEQKKNNRRKKGKGGNLLLPPTSLGFTILGEIFAHVAVL